MSEHTLIAGYVTLCLLGLSIIALFYEHRRRRFEPAPSQDHIFRCKRCSFVYTDDPDVEMSRCPQCGTLNQEVKF